MKKTLAILITTFSLSLGLTPGFTGISGNLVIEAAAHPGRTDANGGHRDNIAYWHQVKENDTLRSPNDLHCS